MPPEVAVLIPTCNHAARLPIVIDSARRCLPRSAQLYVVDRGSQDGTVELARTMPDVRIVRGSGCSLATSLNYAAELARPRDLVILHPDVAVAASQAIESLQSAAYEGSRAGVVGAKTVLPGGLVYALGRNLVSWFGTAHGLVNEGQYVADRHAQGLPRPIDASSDRLVYYRRDVLEACGPWDEQFPHSWMLHDDYGLMARAKGFEVRVQPACRLMEQVAAAPPDWVATIPRTECETYIDRWNGKWGWNPLFPNLHAIRARWGHSAICWRIGPALQDEWDDSQPGVDLLISTYNSAGKLPGTLESLKKTHYRPIELWVLDNGSTDATAAYLDSLSPEDFPFPLHRLRVPVNIGLPSALNWLVHSSHSPLVARLDDDIGVEPDWLTALVDDLRRHPYAGVVGPKVVDNDPPHLVQSADHRFWPELERHSREPDHGQLDYLARVSHVQSCVALYRRKVFTTAALFDNRYSPAQWDDPDHHVALLAAGYDILYDGRVTARHVLSGGSDLSPAACSNSLANQQKLLGKWGLNTFVIIEQALDRSDRRNTYPSQEA